MCCGYASSIRRRSAVSERRAELALVYQADDRETMRSEPLQELVGHLPHPRQVLIRGWAIPLSVASTIHIGMTLRIRRGGRARAVCGRGEAERSVLLSAPSAVS